MTFFTGELGAKRLELLHELVPKATTIAVLVNPNSPNAEAERRDVQAAAHALGQQLIVLDASSERDIDAAFATFVQRGPARCSSARRVLHSPIAIRSSRWRPAMRCRRSTPWREFVEAGGLMSYGTSITDAYRQAGIYAGRILKGEKPADLPVMQSTKFEFVHQPQDRQGARPRPCRRRCSPAPTR